jgi:hypothetical protein
MAQDFMQFKDISPINDQALFHCLGLNIGDAIRKQQKNEFAADSALVMMANLFTGLSTCSKESGMQNNPFVQNYHAQTGYAGYARQQFSYLSTYIGAKGEMHPETAKLVLDVANKIVTGFMAEIKALKATSYGPLIDNTNTLILSHMNATGCGTCGSQTTCHTTNQPGTKPTVTTVAEVVTRAREGLAA